MEIPKDSRSRAIKAASDLIHSSVVEKDNYEQRFTRRAKIMILETLQEHVAHEQQEEAKRRSEQRRS